MAIDEPERLWGFAEAAGPTAGGFGVLGKDDDGKREKLCVRETFRVRIWDANFKVFAETFFHLHHVLSHAHDGYRSYPELPDPQLKRRRSKWGLKLG